jgi:AAA15 family ATPase/GTPase
MIDSISIENFRCFDKLKIKGFKSINLIGGQNNSGKTALLEALLLAVFPTPKSIELLRHFRNENGNLIKKRSDKVWNYFFYNQNTPQPIKIVLSDSLHEQNVELSCIDDVPSIIEELSSLGGSKEKMSELISSNFSNIIALNIKGRIEQSIEQSIFGYYLFPNEENGNIAVLGKVIKTSELPSFLHTTFRLNDSSLSGLYSLTKENKKIKTLNELLNVLDNRIIGSEIDAPGGEPVIKLLLNDGESFPLAMFGDAVRKVTELVLVLLNTSSKVLLIDEIENGIHFTKHRELWTKLFQIVGDDIQIFATSHSLEMIKAFNDVAYQTEFHDKAMYFEMARQQKTQKIIANPMDMEILNTEILTENSFRGE